MKVRSGKLRLFGLVFALTLGLVIGAFAYQASASTAVINIYSDLQRQRCDINGRFEPSVFQGGTFRLKFERYWDELVEVDITFPDGRVFTVPASYFLDGVIDQPFNIPALSVAPANIAGEVGGTLTVPGEWPYGCYKFIGRGLSSGKSAEAFVVVVPGGRPGQNPGPARIAVTRTGSNEAVGQQGAFVDVNGSGFRAQEVISLWITAPDGTVINFPTLDFAGNPLPPVLSDNSGDFQTAFQFEGKNPTGTYQFTALGNDSGYRVIATFTLTGRPSVERGAAQLRVAYPADQADPQRSVFEVQGELFNPGERVDIWVTMPDGSVRGLPSQFADEVGDFFATLYLDERLPTGVFKVTAKGADSGQLVITDFGLTQNQDTEFNPVPGPEILDSNSDLFGPPPETLNPDEEGNPGSRVP
jgi:hypothetical protein